MQRYPAVYMLTNHTNSVLYIGVTSNLVKRIWEHKEKLVAGFSEKYNLYKLVYYEFFATMEEAILREKQLKRWSRKKKEKLINTQNPDWKDLYKLLISSW